MDIHDLLALQNGVVSRAQALGVGLQPHDVRRLVRRRDLTTIHPGVFVDHTGHPTWVQRAWGAVLVCASPEGAFGSDLRAALAGASAMRAADGPGRTSAEDDAIHVAVPRERRVVPPRGVVVVRTFGLDERVQWNLGPPRMKYDEAALDVALGARDDFAAIGAVSRAVQGRHTTAMRMAAALDARTRAPRRDFLAGVLRNVAGGSYSVLEHGFTTLVERPHGLPIAIRQQRVGTTSGIVYRDAVYGERIVELDGRLWHDTAEQRDRDFERDLDAALTGMGTVRLTWGQVYDRPCSTAAKLSRLLMLDGWQSARPCGPGCAVADAA